MNTTTIPSIDVTEPAAPATEPAPAGTYLDLSSQIDHAIGFNPNFYIQFTSVSNEKFCTAPVTLQVFGTGLSKTGTALSSGTVDPHYTLVTPPSGDTPAAGLIGHDYVQTVSSFYVPNGPTTSWISPDPNGSDRPEPAGYYDYRTTFVLAAGLNPQTVVLKGDWAVDNSGMILVNGQQLSSSSGGTINAPGIAAFDMLYPFVITDKSTGSGSNVSFQPGTNTLEFIVYNYDESGGAETSTGLRVDLSGTACCADPVTLPVFGTGVSTTGTELSSGSVDPHFTLVTPPTAYKAVSPYPPSTDAYVQTVPTPYVPNGPSSEWISPDPLGQDSVEPGEGYYDYRTTFILPAGLNLQSVVLTGDWAVDNSGQILVNGNPLSSSSGGTINAPGIAALDTLYPFTITDKSTGSGSNVSFKPDGVMNTLDFLVYNNNSSGGAETSTGLRVDLYGTACCATPVPLAVFGTGLSATGTVLSAGSVDQNYIVVPFGSTQGPPASQIPIASGSLFSPPLSTSTIASPYPTPKYAYVIAKYNYGTTGTVGPYFPDSTTEWISPDPTGLSEPEPNGYYAYQTKFVLAAGLNPETVVLTGDWAVDNEGYILVNGMPVSSTAGGTITTDTAVSFDTLHNFTIGDDSGVVPGSPLFVTGTNYLDFIVHNDDYPGTSVESPTGLRVDLSGTVCCSSSAIFNGTDTSTQGNWVGVYGTQGYDIIDGPVSAPSYATITPAGQSTYVYSTTSSDPRALENVPDLTNNHIAAVWDSASSFTVDVDVTDGNSHNLELYATDFDSEERTETIQLSDAITGTVLDTETLWNFSGGDYLIWTISGNVLITVTNTGPTNGIVNGLFFDPTTTPVSTTMGVTSSLNPPTYGQSVTFTATVNDASGGVPTGSVAFYDGSTDLGSGSSLSGSGNSATSTFTTSALPAGSQSITAFYTPAGNFANSSGSLSQTVNPATLTITANNGSKTYGTLETFLGTAFTETGLVTANGDTITGVTETSTGAPASANVGTYPIVPSAATGSGLSNYKITYIDGTLTITAPPATVQNVTIQKIKTGKHTTSQVIALQFSAALNASDAQNLGVYSLVTVAKSKKQKSKPVALASASYNATTFTVTLVPRKALVLSSPIELTINAAGLLDALGRPLNNGTNVVAVLSKSGVTLNAPTMIRADVRLALDSSAVDAVIEREATIGSRHPIRLQPSIPADLAVVHRPARSFVHH